MNILVNGILFGAGVSFSPGVSFGGVDFFQYKDFDVVADTQDDGSIEIKGFVSKNA